MFEKFTDQARGVVTQAEHEARRLGHYYVGTEHLLLSLIRDNQSAATRTLQSLSINPEEVRRRVEEIIGHGRRTPSSRIPATPAAEKTLSLAAREAKRLNSSAIGTEHLLLGMIREGHGVASQVLVERGAGLRTVRQQVIRLSDGHHEKSVIGITRRIGRIVRTRIIR